MSVAGWVRRLWPGSGAVAAVVPARASDSAAIARLHGAAFHRGWSDGEITALLADPAVTGDCLRAGRVVQGFVLSRRAADEAEILSIAVDRNRRGQGLAARLLLHHMQRLAGLGTRRLFLEVEDGNEAAVRLYRRAGFAEVGRRQGYYASGKTALVMGRAL